ncbi:vWA domain-containing protein [Pelagibaculum spongiae]|uniref:BatB protein n=1 Tax=Pelagibaculum spongiae TaxID=2080658 RepID=A0A2V1GVM0_9GAMM|nr:VWA domain-containing protein [Pelagibaculum spongiae]PVZ64308.1 BatB protein [Pelagibaculum spongiae]
MNFAWPWLFALLPLPWILKRLLPAIKQQGSSLRLPFFNRITLLQNNSHPLNVRHIASSLLFAIGWIALVCAIARPQFIGEPIAQQRNARDVMLAVDLSGSMQAQDMELAGRPVDRLQVIKSMMGPFIERRVGDRIGLILFGSQAFLQAPLTQDTRTINQYLQTSQIRLAGPETAIGDAIALSLKTLKDSPAESRVLILLTDGSNTAGEIEPEKILPLAKQNQLKIHTIGIGGEERIIRDFFGSRRQNPAADLDEALLNLIAEQTGGQYFRARNPQELEKIYQLLDQLEPIEADQQWFYPVEALYFWPLSIFLISLFFNLLFERRRQNV